MSGPQVAHNDAMPTNLFLFNAASSVAAWSAVDDRVMGGCSTSHLRYEPIGHAVFEGTIKPDNNGGFASVRTQVTDIGVSNVSA